MCFDCICDAGPVWLESSAASDGGHEETIHAVGNVALYVFNRNGAMLRYQNTRIKTAISIVVPLAAPSSTTDDDALSFSFILKCLVLPPAYFEVC